MIIDDEREESDYDKSYLFDEDPQCADNDEPTQFPTEHQPTPMETLIANLQEAQSFNEHHNLRNDIMEHMWEFFRH